MYDISSGILKPIFAALVLLFIGLPHQTKAQDVCRADTSFTDILFLIDNSGSIDDDEFALFSNLITGSIDRVRERCESSQLGVVHYGGAFGLETAIEFPFSATSLIPAIDRQFCATRNQFDNCSDGGGDDLNNAIGDIISFIQDGSLNRDPVNQLSLVIFTDAFGFDTECGFINCSVIRPFTNIDILKSQFEAQVTVVGVSDQAEASLLGLYASPGGTFDDVSLFQQDCASTFDGCVLPRKYIQLDFDAPVVSSSDSIAICVDCSIRIIGGVSVDAGPDQMVCEEEDGTITLTATLRNGTPPVSFVWDQGLGLGNDFQVAPQVTTTYTVTGTDANGCSATDMITITVEDCFPDCPTPIITCPPDISDCPEGSIDPAITGFATAIIDTSICDLVNVSFEDFPVTSDCPGAVIIRRVWRAEISTNPANFSTCEQMISLVDTVPPVLVACPTDTILDPDNPTYTWLDPLVVDDCGATLSYNIPNGSVFPVGQTVVTAFATDVCGNIDSCSFTVTVPDEVQLICPPTTQRCVDTLVTIPLPEAISDCPLCMEDPANCITISTTINDIRREGEEIIYDITYVARDLCNTDDSCSTTIVLDNNSFVDCPPDIVIEAPPFGFTDVSWSPPTYETCCDVCIVRQLPGFLYMGQLGDSYYYCSYARVSWEKANREAQDIGGHLVAINSAAENEFLSRRLIDIRAYIGLNDRAMEGDYQWTNGDPFSFASWKNTQPDGGQNENVTEMDAQGYWYDVDGRDRREFVVEVSECVQVTQIGGPEPGSRFRVGTTTITYAGADGCGNRDICSFDVTLLPFQEEAAEQTAITRSSSTELTIAPNPTNTYLEVTSNRNLTSVQIFSMQGQVLRTWHIKSSTTKRLDVSDLPPGVQFIKVALSDGTEEIRKVILLE